MTLYEVNKKYAPLVMEAQEYLLSIGASPRAAQKEADDIVYRDQSADDGIDEHTWWMAHASRFLELESVVN